MNTLEEPSRFDSEPKESTCLTPSSHIGMLQSRHELHDLKCILLCQKKTDGTWAFSLEQITGKLVPFLIGRPYKDNESLVLDQITPKKRHQKSKMTFLDQLNLLLKQDCHSLEWTSLLQGNLRLFPDTEINCSQAHLLAHQQARKVDLSIEYCATEVPNPNRYEFNLYMRDLTVSQSISIKMAGITHDLRLLTQNIHELYETCLLLTSQLKTETDPSMRAKLLELLTENLNIITENNREIALKCALDYPNLQPQTLINNMLTEASDLKYEIEEEIELSPALTDYIKIFRNSMIENFVIILNIEASLILKLSLFNAVKAFLFNLIMNTKKPDLDIHEVRINAKSAYLEGESVINIEIIDDGIGMPEEKMRDFFDRDLKTEPNLSHSSKKAIPSSKENLNCSESIKQTELAKIYLPRNEGTTLSHIKLCQLGAHKAKVQARPDGFRGSFFSISLPAKHQNQMHLTPEQQQDLKSLSRENLIGTILSIDDSYVSQKSLFNTLVTGLGLSSKTKKTILAMNDVDSWSTKQLLIEIRDGWAIIFAHNGLVGLDAQSLCTIDVIFTDESMPIGPKGHELISMFRDREQSERRNPAKIALLSGDELLKNANNPNLENILTQYDAVSFTKGGRSRDNGQKDPMNEFIRALHPQIGSFKAAFGPSY